jgi:hypothetical protein
MRQRTEVTFEIEETVVLRRGGRLLREHCPLCQTPTDLASLEVLSLLSGLSKEEIYCLVAAGLVYAIGNGEPLACLKCFWNLRSPIDARLDSKTASLP